MNQTVRPAQIETGAPVEALAGTVERVTFHNVENGFCVLKVHARGKRDLVTVVAHAPAIGAGEWITASGAWVSDRVHGLQFKANVLKATPPTGAEGIEKYLASGQMRGIGPAMAKRIVAAFGEGTFEVIEATPERLTEVAGIGPWRASRIVAGWAEQKAVREIMIFLHAQGVGTARAVRIFKTYGHEAIRVMTEDPYRLARDVRGIGFRTADAIAAQLGVEKTSSQRLRAGVSFALQTATDEGHCGLPVAMLVTLAEKLLEVDAALIRTAIAEEFGAGRMCSRTRWMASRACSSQDYMEPNGSSPRACSNARRTSRPGLRLTSTKPFPGSSRRPARRCPPRSTRPCALCSPPRWPWSRADRAWARPPRWTPSCAS